MQGSLKNLFVKPLDMPKLLQINVTANWGSTGKIAEQIGLAAMDAGWESYIAYGRDCKPSMSRLIKIGSRFSVYMHVLQARLFDRAGLGSWLATKRLIRTIHDIKPDIIHLHNIHGYILNYKLLFDYLSRIQLPVVWTFHDFWAITGHCTHFKDCEKWKEQCGRCVYSWTYPRSYSDFSKKNKRIKERCFSSANLYVVAVSSWVEKLVGQSFLNGKNIRTITNGVDLRVLRKLPLSSSYNFNPEEYTIIGVASKWSKDKGFDDYLKLSQYLRPDEKIVLVGLDEKQIKQLPSGIIGLQKTDTQEQLAELYSRADVVLSLSYAETFGLTIAESMACGTPVIAYDNTAQADLLTEETGIKVKTGDVDGVYEAIRMMRKIGKDHFSQACRARAEEHFDKEKCFRKYIELYEEILNKSK